MAFQGENYGARLDRTVHDPIALSARVNNMQTALTHTFGRQWPANWITFPLIYQAIEWLKLSH